MTARAQAFFRFVGAGLLRLAAYVGVASLVAGGAGLVWGLVSGSDDLAHSTALGLYVGGVAMLAVGLLSGGRPVDYRGKYGENLGQMGGAGAQAAALVGVGVVLLGVALDALA